MCIRDRNDPVTYPLVANRVQTFQRVRPALLLAELLQFIELRYGYDDRLGLALDLDDHLVVLITDVTYPGLGFVGRDGFGHGSVSRAHRQGARTARCLFVPRYQT